MQTPSSQERLGLFDTPPSRGEIAIALGTVGVFAAAVLASLPFSQVRLAEFSAVTPMVCAVMVVGQLIVATLLYGQAVVFSSRALTVLASGYIASALVTVPYGLSFPGAFDGLIPGGLSTAVWLTMFQRWIEALAITLYALLKPADAAAVATVKRPRLLPWAVGAAAFALALTLLATVGHDLLPTMMIDRRLLLYPRALAFAVSELALLIAAIALLLRGRDAVMDVWLLVTAAVLLMKALFGLTLHARYSVGWYGGAFLLLASHIVLPLALIVESNRLYVRLALSTAAQRRERDDRLISADKVAAAISHEVGQPLAAVSLSASSALKSLTRAPPDQKAAISLLSDTIDASQRAFAVVKSLRAKYAERADSVSVFDLNELIRESAALLHREITAQRVSLRLVLGEELPPMQANRVQIQRVLVNLLLNAIEAVAGNPSRTRRINVRSAPGEFGEVLVEITDAGPGLPPEAIGHVFEPFFTTKTLGTGLGLSLSQEIVTSHGGRLWASNAPEGGAVFHLELPSSRARPAKKASAG